MLTMTSLSLRAPLSKSFSLLYRSTLWFPKRLVIRL